MESQHWNEAEATDSIPAIQQEQAAEPAPVETPAPRPAQPIKIEKGSLRGNMTADAAHRRKLQELQLQRERILSERTANVHRRSALATALIDIEEKLAELGWTIHL
jgi:hypothetical protein